MMPTLPRINVTKSDKLPGSDSLKSARERILEWWTSAYRTPAYQGRFTEEAKRSPETVWTGRQYQRVRLKTDQQLAEWHGSAG